MPWPDAAAMVHQVREDCVGALAQAGQLVGRNHPEGPISMDGGHLEEGVWVSHPKRRHGDASGAVRRRKVCQPTSLQGRISITGMHGSESKAGARISSAHSLSGKANKGNYDGQQVDLWRL